MPTHSQIRLLATLVASAIDGKAPPTHATISACAAMLDEFASDAISQAEELDAMAGQLQAAAAKVDACPVHCWYNRDTYRDALASLGARTRRRLLDIVKLHTLVESREARAKLAFARNRLGKRYVDGGQK